MKEDIWQEETPYCPLCGGGGSPLYQGLHDRRLGTPGVWSFFHCEQCHVLWLNPRLRREDLYKAYANCETHTLPDRQLGLIRLQRAIAAAILSRSFGYHSRSCDDVPPGMIILGSLPPLKEQVNYGLMFLPSSDRGLLLDVGCGNGSFLAFMRGLGWNVMGVEPDPEAARVAREHLGLQVIVGTLGETLLKENTFDAITMHHVIEHMLDPLYDLKRCFDLLKPGGKLAIVTPNIKSLGHVLFKESWFALDPPRHLILFSPEGLCRVVESIGFQVTYLSTTARGAGGIYTLSKQIRLHGHIKHTRTPLIDKLGLRIFATLEHLVKSFYDIYAGEEIGILAMRRGTK